MNIHERPNVKTFCAWSRYRYYFFLYNTQAALLGHICAAHIRYDKKIARSCSEQYVLTPLSMHCTVLCCAQVQLIVTISEPRWAGDIGHLRRHFLLHKQSNGKISSRLKSLTFYGPIVSSPSSCSDTIFSCVSAFLIIVVNLYSLCNHRKFIQVHFIVTCQPHFLLRIISTSLL